MKRILHLLTTIVFLTTVFNSCSKDPAAEGSESQTPNAQTDDWTVSNVVKTFTTDARKLIYSDYAYRYYLQASAGGPLMIIPQVRNDFGNWEDGLPESSWTNVGIKSEGEKESLASMTSYSPGLTSDHRHIGDYSNLTEYAFSYFKPKHGYTAWFLQETGNRVFFKIYALSYVLNSQDDVYSVTYQYQLY